MLLIMHVSREGSDSHENAYVIEHETFPSIKYNFSSFHLFPVNNQVKSKLYLPICNAVD